MQLSPAQKQEVFQVLVRKLRSTSSSNWLRRPGQLVRQGAAPFSLDLAALGQPVFRGTPRQELEGDFPQLSQQAFDYAVILARLPKRSVPDRADECLNPHQPRQPPLRWSSNQPFTRCAVSTWRRPKPSFRLSWLPWNQVKTWRSPGEGSLWPCSPGRPSSLRRALIWKLFWLPPGPNPCTKELISPACGRGLAIEAPLPRHLPVGGGSGARSSPGFAGAP